MVTADLMNQVVEASHLDSPAARDAVEALFESVGDALERGDRVVLRRFGTSHVAARRTGVARNPRTNEPVQMPWAGWCVPVPRRVSLASPTAAERAPLPRPVAVIHPRPNAYFRRSRTALRSLR